jgi:hypothetical protein
MRISRRFLGWGVFFIALGLVPLAVQLGWVDRSAVADLWRLWPLILVGAGVGLLLTRTRLEALGGIIAAATCGLLLGGILTAGANLGTICGPGSGGTTVANRSGILEPGAAVNIELSCGRLSVGTAPGNAWKVAWGPAEKDEPTILGSGAALRVRGPEGTVTIFPGTSGSIWDVSLPQGSVTRLDLRLNAASATLPLDGLSVSGVDIQANAADARVDLGAASASTVNAQVNVGSLRLGLPATGPTTGEIEANLSSIVLCAPPGLPLRIVTKASLAGVDLPGLTRVGDEIYQSDDWNPAAGVQLRVQVNLGSLKLERGGTCR